MSVLEIEEIFHAALTLPPGARGAFLRGACGGDSQAVARLQSLLDSYDGSGDFLETPAVELIFPAARQVDIQARIDTRIGNYRIVRLIAAGGMGIVYEARQAAPRRTVALKLLRRGLHSASAVQRFRRESELLGRLRHVGIAQVFEAGVQEEEGWSTPFFAMEYLPGAVPVTSFADAGSLGLEGRLELLCKVCDAVQYCHEQGVIHRDLKPANILVTPEGQPKVIDFGVAQAQANPSTWHTTGNPLIGSLPYMSPEQAGGAEEGVDSQTDVYALGVIAYELLCGRMPHDLADVPPLEAVRVIRDEDPPPLATFDRRFCGDLETIVTTAMAKEKARRYPSAAALAADLRRHLRDEPIQARKAGTWYQLRKLARRNRALTAGVAVAFAGLLAGGIGATLQAISARKESDRAERALAESRRVTDFVQSILMQANPKVHGRDLSVRDALDRAARRVDAELAGDARARALIHRTIAEAYWAIGDLAAAERHFQASLASWAGAAPGADEEVHCTAAQLARLRLFAGDFRGAEETVVGLEEQYRHSHHAGHPFLADLDDLKAQLAHARGEIEASIGFARRALAARRSALDDSSPAVAESLVRLATALDVAGDLDEAIALSREALSVRRAALGAHNNDAIWEMNHLAFFLGRRARPEDLREAESLLRAAIVAHAEAVGEESLDVATTMSELGGNLLAQGRGDEARELVFRALAAKQALLGEDHLEVAQTLQAIGLLHMGLGRPGEAVPLFERAAAIRVRRLGSAHPDTLCSTERLTAARELARKGSGAAEHR